MSRLDSLPPDLHAVLSLLLRQHKRHAEVAAMLGIQERAVHDRAHAALALLAPRQARALSAAQREQLGEYLLGQQDPAAERETHAQLEDSASGRAWAQSLATELAPLAAQPLPQIPAGRAAGIPAARAAGAPSRAHPDTPATAGQPSHLPAAAPTQAGVPPGPSVSPARTPLAPSSRVGGAVILGALVVIVVVVVLLVVGIGGGGGGGSHTGTHQSAAAGQTTNARSKPASGTSSGASANTTTSASAGTAAGTGTTTSGSQTTHGKALPLTPPDPATSKAVGVAYVLTQKGQRAFYVFAKGLPAPPTGSFYAVWLEGASSAAAYPLGSLPAQNSNGLVEGIGPLPSNASSYTRIIVTSETSHKPTHPGPTALGGTFTLG
jgi:hypothetical protein